MSKGDRNTAITVAIVLIVCTISLVAVLTALWRLVGYGVTSTLNSVGLFIKVNTIDYNFIVPDSGSGNVANNPPDIVVIPPPSSSSSSASSTSSKSSSSGIVPKYKRVVPANYSYNFPIPKLHEIEGEESFLGFQDAILSDAQLAGYGSGEDTPQANLNISIPKIDVKSPVLQGLGGEDLLQKGFWVYPGSHTLGEGEIVLLCHRRYFGPYDPRTCWNVDKLAVGDDIFLQGNAQEINYKIIAVNVFAGDDPTIYSISDTEDYLKIVTCHPLYSNENRIVILAKKS